MARSFQQHRPTAARRCGATRRGAVPLLLSGTPGINYAIQMATNLTAPNWMPLATNSPANGTFRFTDPGATNKSRFTVQGRTVTSSSLKQ